MAKSNIQYPEPFIDLSTGTLLTPSPGGKLCLGNGKHKTPEGEEIEICCDNCPGFLCCFPDEEFCKKWCDNYGICYSAD